MRALARIHPNFGGLATDARVRLLNPPIPDRRFLWRINTARTHATLELPNSAAKRITIELKPMLGRVAVAPRGEEAFGGLWPGDFGDGHARQGHGELDGTA